MNISISDGIIKSISEKPVSGNAFNAGGRLVVPGFIDTHVHVREPGCEEKEDWGSAGKAALAGGITTIFNIQNNDPQIITKKDVLVMKKLAAKCAVNYGIFGIVSEKSLSHLKEMSNEVIGYKAFMARSAGGTQTAGMDILERAFEIIAGLGKVLTLHCEDPDIIEENSKGYTEHSKIRSREAEISAIKKAIALAKKYRTRINIAHVSTVEGADLILKAKKEMDITFETCPHYLFLNEDNLSVLGSVGKVNPPLRTKKDNVVLQTLLCKGKIDMLTSDHAPHTEEQKNGDHPPSGIVGLETMFPLIFDLYFSGKLPLETLINVTSTNPARIYGLEKKGKIAVGYDADLVVVDDSEDRVDETQFFSKFKKSPYNGWKLRGWPHATIVKGKIYTKSDIS